MIYFDFFLCHWMEVYHLHRATSFALLKLSDDLVPFIMDFIRPTRLDWRTCRKHEADLIKRLQQVVANSLVEPGMQDWIFDEYTRRELATWSLYGVLYIISWLNKGGIYQYGRPPRCRPSAVFHYYYSVHYHKWYTQTFMWCCYV